MSSTPNSIPHPELEITQSDLSQLIVALYGYDADSSNWAMHLCRDPTVQINAKFEFMILELKRHMERKAKQMGDFEQPEHDRLRESYEHTGRLRKSIGRFVLGFANNFKTN